MLGTRQTGMQQFHIADIVRDRELLPRVRAAAKVLLSEYPDRIQPIIERWIGQRQDYADV
jgi:ATP-dependent DNA helicase RecG